MTDIPAIAPDRDGYVDRDGVRTYYAVYGTGPRTVLLLPSWSIAHSRVWKAQIAYLSRHYRVVLFDGRGNGKSDRPVGEAAYRPREFVADAAAVLDATETRKVVAIGVSFGGHLAALFSALHPDRVDGAVLISPAAPFGPANPSRGTGSFMDPPVTTEGWGKYNSHYWRTNYPDFAQFFFERAFPEPHSTKQIEDTVGWAAETTPETMIDTVIGRAAKDDNETLYRSIRCPVLVMHGDKDEVVPYAKGAVVAEATGGRLITLEGSGHLPQARDPALVNLMIRDFVEGLSPPTDARWPDRIPRGLSRPRKALYLSSPIGLGHARRDIAIAAALRERHPDLTIDWLAQHPVTPLLAERGERVHPASNALLSESRHITDASRQHELHVFQALREMDEILIANFMRFQEVVDEERYDLIIADEAWEVDHFWHEHPELKRAPLVWMTDFVGYLPTPEGGAHEAGLTADYNAEMIEHIARYPRQRDRAIFIGQPDDIVPGTFGPTLPDIRAWTEAHFDFSGYVVEQDPASFGARATLRESLGYAPGERVCIAAVGGSGVGQFLLRHILTAWPEVRRQVPGLRLIVVAGPRIAPESLTASSLTATEGVEIRGFVPDLPRHFAACDLALVQGGLGTCMELAAARTPFIYFPLQRHFEQLYHVHHRLQRYGAGRRMDLAEATPERLAAAMLSELKTGSQTHAVETDGARRAAEMIAALL